MDSEEDNQCSIINRGHLLKLVKEVLTIFIISYRHVKRYISYRPVYSCVKCNQAFE